MTVRFEFRDAYGRPAVVTPCWVMNTKGGGGRPAVQFRLACGECLQVPQEIVPDVLVAVREAAAEVGPKSPAAIHTPAHGGLVELLPMVGEGAGTGCVLPGQVRNEQNTGSGTCSGPAGTACSGTPGTPGLNTGLNTGGTPCSDGFSDVFPQVVMVKPLPECSRILVAPKNDGTPRNTGGTPRSHPGGHLADRCEDCGTGTYLMAGGAYAACARLIAAAEAEQPPVPPHSGWVRGRCPACRGTSLFAAEDGYLTCSRLECPDPGALADILDGHGNGWVRTSEALKAVHDADQAVERLTSRAMAVRERVLGMEPALRDELLRLLTDREAPTGSTAAAVAACAAGPEAER